MMLVKAPVTDYIHFYW